MADTLTPDAVLAMPAGEAMDELVATRVLGLKQETSYVGGTYWTTSRGKYVSNRPPMFSDSIADAEYVLDWLRERWGRIGIVYDNPDWVVWKVSAKPHFAAPTLPLALCRAALLESLRTEGK